MVAIKTKQHNFRLWMSGAFGNRLRAWRTLDEWRKSDFCGCVSLRYLGSAGGGPCRYDINPSKVDEVVEEWIKCGLDPNKIVVNEGAPDDAVLVQGEYLNEVVPLKSVEGFSYSCVKLKMREAFAVERINVTGLIGRFILRTAMTPSSWSDFNELLELYPDHVIEVPVYSRCISNIPGRNAIVWEVRQF